MYRVGVIGLGSIAAMYGTPEEKAPYCHVGGIRYSDRVRLWGVADLSPEVRERFRERWGSVLPADLRWFGSAVEMLAAGPPDIVAVCVRGPHHYAVMKEVIAAGPKAIFLEKPPTCSLEEMDSMVAAAREKGIPITVSYSRHWAPHVLRLEQLVKDGLIGEVRKVVGYTGASFLSFASHTTDMISQFAGYDPVAVYARGSAPDPDPGSAPDGYEPEPSLEAMTIEYESGILGVQVNAEGEYGGFYADVFGTEGCVRAGIYTPPFARNGKIEPIDLTALGMPENASVFTVAYDQIAGYLDGGPLPACTDAAWHAVHEIGFAGIESLRTDRRIPIPNANRSRLIYANG